MCMSVSGTHNTGNPNMEPYDPIKKKRSCDVFFGESLGKNMHLFICRENNKVRSSDLRLVGTIKKHFYGVLI